MKKFFTKIAGVALGLAMAIGVGAAIRAGVKEVGVNATIGDLTNYGATMAGGNHGSDAKVNSNSNNGIKVGTSSAGGTMTITVASGSTYLKLKAAAWKGVTGLSLNITPQANVNPTSISLTADTGVSGSGAFMTDGNNEDFGISLSSITSNTTLTFTTSTEKRCVVWDAKTKETITFNGNNATSGTAPTNLVGFMNSNVTLPSSGNLAKTGMVFSGWNTKADGTGTNYASGASYQLGTEAVTLYAKWTAASSDPYVTIEDKVSGHTGQTPTIQFSYGNFDSTLNIISNNENVVKIGTITATNPASSSVVFDYRGEGKTTVDFKDGASVVKSVEVTVTQTTLELNKSSTSIAQNESETLTANCNVGTANWSSNSNKVTVENGVVTVASDARVGDVVRITATSSVDKNVSSYCDVTILKGVPVVTDVITYSKLSYDDQIGSSTYTTFNSGTNLNGYYVGNANNATNQSTIQFRTDNNSGIIATQTAGKRVKSIAVVFASNTSSTRKLDVYVSNSAYSGSDASILYGSDAGTNITSFTYTSTNASQSYVFAENENYKYIGLRSNNGALYLDSVTIVWELYTASDLVTKIDTLAGGWDNDVATSNCKANYTTLKEMVLLTAAAELSDFRTNTTDSDIVAARKTYEWWCARNNDASPYSGEIVSGAATVNKVVNFNDPTALTTIIIVVSLTSVVVIGGYFFLRKRKQQ